MKILLTAPPATGKSTVIGKVVESFVGSKRGIVAREIKDESGQRLGFTAINEAGESRQFMFYTEHPNENSVGGQFDVDIQALDEFVVHELRAGLADRAGLLYVDEVGRAQAKSAAFLQVLRQIFADNCHVLASIVYEDEPWSLEFKRHPDVCILEVTPANRHALPDILLAAFAYSELLSALRPAQQAQVIAWLRELLAVNQVHSAKKLFANALGYLAGGKIQAGKTPGEYVVAGQTRDHRIVCDESGAYLCDCDLANGRGQFVGKAGICSHEMSIRLSRL